MVPTLKVRGVAPSSAVSTSCDACIVPIGFEAYDACIVLIGFEAYDACIVGGVVDKDNRGGRQGFASEPRLEALRFIVPASILI